MDATWGADEGWEPNFGEAGDQRGHANRDLLDGGMPYFRLRLGDWARSIPPHRIRQYMQ